MGILGYIPVISHTSWLIVCCNVFVWSFNLCRWLRTKECRWLCDRKLNLPNRSRLQSMRIAQYVNIHLSNLSFLYPQINMQYKIGIPIPHTPNYHIASFWNKIFSVPNLIFAFRSPLFKQYRCDLEKVTTSVFILS